MRQKDLDWKIGTKWLKLWCTIHSWKSSAMLIVTMGFNGVSCPVTKAEQNIELYKPLSAND